MRKHNVALAHKKQTKKHTQSVTHTNSQSHTVTQTQWSACTQETDIDRMKLIKDMRKVECSRQTISSEPSTLHYFSSSIPNLSLHYPTTSQEATTVI